MNDSRLLYDAFNIYYNKAIEALQNNEFSVARRNFLSASETLLKLARYSNSVLREKRIARAKELVHVADKLEAKIKKSNSICISGDSIDNDYTNYTTPKVYDVEDYTVEESIDQLMKLEGLHTVKEQIHDLITQIQTFKMRKSQGLPTPELSHHMVFTGNPGTGKTTVARIIGRIYKALGILSKGHFVEVDRADLVAGHVGQTALKTKARIAEAMGGILFIDEAYTLKKEGNDFGQEAIDTLNKVMEDLRSDLVVIVAGYKEEISNFIEANKGLSSRFKTYIDFEDYSGKELFNIFLGILKNNKYLINDKASELVKDYLSNPGLNKLTGNARDVRNLFENIVKLQSRRIVKLDNPLAQELMLITEADLPFKESKYSLEDSIREEPHVSYKSKQQVSNKIEEDETNIDSYKYPNVEVIDDMFKDNNQISEEYETNIKDLLKKRKPKFGESFKEVMPEDEYLNSNSNAAAAEYKFDWDSLPVIDFDDIAGLESVKDVVRTKVLLPLEHPEAFEGYEKKNGGGLFLYGPPGTGKTMIAAAIANEIGAKFCSVKPSDLLHQGAGNTEKAVRALFAQARQYPCSVIYFDEMDSIAQKNTKSSYSKQLRSELLSQLQGIESYGKDSGNLLFLIAATNKPWDVDSAFVRPGRFGTKVYVGLPDDETRRYMITYRFIKITNKGIVEIDDDVDIDDFVDQTNGFNGSDITNVLDRIDEISAIRGVLTNNKFICQADIDKALSEIHSSVQSEDIDKLITWKEQNNG